MLRYRAHIAVLSAVLAVSSVGAARAEHAVAVLGVEPIDVPEALAQQLTDALRQRAAATGGLRVIQGKDLIEIKMVFGCDGETPACLAQAGKSLGADKLLYGTLKKTNQKGKDLILGLKLLDVKSASVEKFINEPITKRELAAGSVNASASRWFAQLVEVESKPTLTVTSEPPNAAVAVDGQQMGRTPVTLRELSPGTHTIAVSANGKQTATRSVELRSGGTHEVVVTLEPEAVAVTPPSPKPETPSPGIVQPPSERERLSERHTTSHAGRPAKFIALGAVVGAVVAGGVAIYTWRTYSGLEDTAHADLMKVKSGLTNVTDEQAKFFAKPNCNPTSISGPLVDQYKKDCSSGETFANATTALWVVAGALAGAGVISYVIGDRQAAHAAERPRTTAHLIRQSLRVAPVISTQGGGLQAAFEF